MRAKRGQSRIVSVSITALGIQEKACAPATRSAQPLLMLFACVGVSVWKKDTGCLLPLFPVGPWLRHSHEEETPKKKKTQRETRSRAVRGATTEDIWSPPPLLQRTATRPLHKLLGWRCSCRCSQFDVLLLLSFFLFAFSNDHGLVLGTRTSRTEDQSQVGQKGHRCGRLSGRRSGKCAKTKKGIAAQTHARHTRTHMSQVSEHFIQPRRGRQTGNRHTKAKSHLRAKQSAAAVPREQHAKNAVGAAATCRAHPAVFFRRGAQRPYPTHDSVHLRLRKIRS